MRKHNGLLHLDTPQFDVNKEMRYGSEIQELVKEQTNAYETMRAYFSDIVASSQDLIKALKADVGQLQRREAAAVALAHEAAAENKSLKEPLQLVSLLISSGRAVKRFVCAHFRF